MAEPQDPSPGSGGDKVAACKLIANMLIMCQSRKRCESRRVRLRSSSVTPLLTYTPSQIDTAVAKTKDEADLPPSTTFHSTIHGVTDRKADYNPIQSGPEAARRRHGHTKVITNSAFHCPARVCGESSERSRQCSVCFTPEPGGGGGTTDTGQGAPASASEKRTRQDKRCAKPDTNFSVARNKDGGVLCSGVRTGTGNTKYVPKSPPGLSPPISPRDNDGGAAAAACKKWFLELFEKAPTLHGTTLTSAPLGTRSLLV
ncbi:hypothetical protein B0T13DRAFT_447095 [Neurospora crassa]|nr:hypothetical protein B0T13DRAFT_447095 [Neurospora crassa]